MLIRELEQEDEVITDLKSFVEVNNFTLRWKWPRNSEVVYLYKLNAMDKVDIEDINEKNLKLYTKDEYKEFNGYVEKIKDIGQYRYIVFPVIEGELEPIILKQYDERNQVLLCTGKTEIVYEIVEHKKIFSTLKIVKMTIYANTPIKKETLCYVKKQGTYPESEEEGVKFDFITDFSPGQNPQQALEIGKNEYIRVFLKDNKEYDKMYTLIRR